MKLTFLISAAALTFAVACKNSPEPMSSKLTYPVTAKSDHVDQYFGEDVPDPYHWLESDTSKATMDWVEAENKVTFGYLDKIKWREDLKKRLQSLINYERISAPEKQGPFEYFYKNTGLQNHSVLYRKPKGNTTAEPELYLDPNGFSKDGTIGLSDISFTKDGTLSAHQITEGGSDWRKVIVMDAIKKVIIEDTLRDVKFSGVSWYGNDGFYYSSYDKPKEGSQLSGKTQYHKLFYHKLKTPQSSDVLIYGGEKQPNRYIGGYVTEDQKYLVITAAESTSGNQLFVQDLSVKNGPFIPISVGYEKDINYVENEGSKFYFLTNIDAPNFRVFSVDLRNP